MSKRLAVLGSLGALGFALGVSDCLFDYAGAERCTNGTGGGCPDTTTSSSASMTSSSSSMPSSCHDGQRDGHETDKDCGGDGGCKRCTPGQTCKSGSDCDSAVCDHGTCAPIKTTTRWKAIVGSPHPANRLGAGVAALDGGKVLVYGGFDDPDVAQADLRDTWELDDSVWKQAASGTSRVNYPSMAFDESIGKALLAGGVTYGGAAQSTTFWYDSVSGWTDGPDLPAARYGATLVYEPKSRRLILFGGYAGGVTADIHTLTASDGGSPSWKQDAPSSSDNLSKLPRYYHAAAYDTDLGRMVVFGGEDANTVAGTLGDTWAFSPAEDTWKKLDAGTLLTARYGSVMAYDAHRGVMVLYGGSNHEAPNGHTLAETWELKANGWQNMDLALPDPNYPQRAFAALVYDSVRQRVVLFGGGYGLHQVGGTYEYLTYGEPCPPGMTKCVNGSQCVDGVCCASESCSGMDRCNTPENPGICTDPGAGM